MKIQFLGTAAAEGVPALFCDCDICKYSRKKGGKNIRSRSQSIIDDRLLIEFPQDAFYHSVRFNISYANINNCLISHTHSDHWYPHNFEFIIDGYSHLHDNYVFNVYGSIDCLKEIQPYVDRANGKLKFHEIKAYNKYIIDGYMVVPLKATHGTDNPFIYIISKGNKCMFYAHDTGVLPQESLDYILKNISHFDFISFDTNCANDESVPYSAHMCLNNNIDLRRILEEHNIVDKKTICVCNHFSHNGSNSTYDEFKKIAKKHCFEISYDGMIVEF